MIHLTFPLPRLQQLYDDLLHLLRRVVLRKIFFENVYATA